MSRIQLLLAAFLHCNRGNFAIAAVVVLPMLAGITGGAVDLYTHQFQQSSLQNAADNAALAAAREASLKGWNVTTAKAVADNFLTETLAQVGMKRATYNSIVTVDPKIRRVSVTVEQDDYGYFFLGYFKGSPQITVNAVAASSGKTNVCIIVKSEHEEEAFKLSGTGSVTAQECSAYSNSDHPRGIVGKKRSRLRTETTCSAGGFGGLPRNFSPLPLSDCPKISDPLLDRADLLNKTFKNPKCDHKNLELKNGYQILYPGTYCGQTIISDKSVAYLRPGIYIIKNGRLIIDKNASIIGRGIGFIFIGNKSRFIFKNESTIAMSAPKTGPMAGIIFYAKPAKEQRVFRIESNDAKRLIGTVYLPNEKLKIGADEDDDGICDLDLEFAAEASSSSAAKDVSEIESVVSDLCETSMGKLSAWTAIVVDKLKVTNGVELIINADYDSTPVPVPDGIGPVPGNFRLVQ